MKTTNWASTLSASVPMFVHGNLLGWVLYADTSRWWLVFVAVMFTIGVWQAHLAVKNAYQRGKLVGKIEGADMVSRINSCEHYK